MQFKQPVILNDVQTFRFFITSFCSWWRRTSTYRNLSDSRKTAELVVMGWYLSEQYMCLGDFKTVSFPCMSPSIRLSDSPIYLLISLFFLRYLLLLNLFFLFFFLLFFIFSFSLFIIYRILFLILQILSYPDQHSCEFKAWIFIELNLPI
jgi:hypothetical protein